MCIMTLLKHFYADVLILIFLTSYNNKCVDIQMQCELNYQSVYHAQTVKVFDKSTPIHLKLLEP